MAIKYRISQRKNNLKGKEEPLYMFQAISSGLVDLEQLSTEISNECTLTKVDVAAVLLALGEKMREHLEEGHTVSLENIGRFKVGFKSKAHSDKKLLRKKEITKFHINYQPAPKLKKWLKSGLKIAKLKEK